MIKINFICERCELQSEDIMVDSFVISFDSIPDNFFVFLENGKTVFMCKKCNDQNEHIKNEFLKTDRGEFTSQYNEEPVNERS